MAMTIMKGIRVMARRLTPRRIASGARAGGAIHRIGDRYRTDHTSVGMTERTNPAIVARNVTIPSAESRIIALLRLFNPQTAPTMISTGSEQPAASGTN